MTPEVKSAVEKTLIYTRNVLMRIMAGELEDVITPGITKIDEVLAQLAALPSPSELQSPTQDTIDEAVTFIFVELAKMLGVEKWSIQDGTVSWDDDVRATLHVILEAAKAPPAKPLQGEISPASREEAEKIVSPAQLYEPEHSVLVNAIAYSLEAKEREIERLTNITAEALAGRNHHRCKSDNAKISRNRALDGLDHWKSRAEEAEAALTACEAKLAEEIAIVDRIWRVLGITSYEGAGGLSIDEIVESWKSRAETAEAKLANTTAYYLRRRSGIGNMAAEASVGPPPEQGGRVK